MLTNFIYAKSKAMFEERIAEVPNDAIVFIEDTKEIWTHGHYFDCSTLDPSIIPNLQMEVAELLANVNNKANVNGSYPDMTVGFAEDLGGAEFTQESEFTIRATADGEIVKDGAARIESIKGNSVVWNQLLSGDFSVQYGTLTQVNNKYTIVPSGDYPGIKKDGVVPIVGHKYIAICSKTGGSSELKLNWAGYDEKVNMVFTASNVNKSSFIIYGNYEVDTFTLIRPILVDLTMMFGSGNEPTTIEQFYQRIPMGVDMNAYNEGEVIGVRPDGIKSVGVNQWDEEWELGGVDGASGQKYDSTTRIRTRNYIPIVSGATYHIHIGSLANNATAGSICWYDEGYKFIEYVPIYAHKEYTAPASARYCLIGFYTSYGTTYNHDICINISDAEKNGTYESYIKRIQTLDIIGKYFPEGMRSVGTAHDEIRYNKASQKWEKVQRIGEVDLGTIDYSRGKYGDVYAFSCQIPQANKMVGLANMTCGIYVARAVGAAALNNMEMRGDDRVAYPNSLYIRNDAYTDTASFKAAMRGVMLYYELATPIITEIEDPGFSYQV